MKQQSSGDESAKEEEAEVLRLQRERAKSATREDFGLEDICQNESDAELTFEVGFADTVVSLVLLGHQVFLSLLVMGSDGELNYLEVSVQRRVL